MENIEVLVRIRPPNDREIESNDFNVWSGINTDTIGVSQDKYTELMRQRKLVPGQKIQFTYSTLYIIILFFLIQAYFLKIKNNFLSL